MHDMSGAWSFLFIVEKYLLSLETSNYVTNTEFKTILIV